MPQGGMRTSQKLQSWGQGIELPGSVLRKAGGGEAGVPARCWASVPYGGPGGTDVSMGGLHHPLTRALLGTGGARCCPVDLGPIVPAGPWLSCSNVDVTWIHARGPSGLGTAGAGAHAARVISSFHGECRLRFPGVQACPLPLELTESLTSPGLNVPIC